MKEFAAQHRDGPNLMELIYGGDKKAPKEERENDESESDVEELFKPKRKAKSQSGNDSMAFYLPLLSCDFLYFLSYDPLLFCCLGHLQQ